MRLTIQDLGGQEYIHAARMKLTARGVHSPLRTYDGLNRRIGAELWCKHENFNPGGSFKIRNALMAFERRTAGDRTEVVAATRGNHGIGLAIAGKEAGIPVRIFVPSGSTPDKCEIMSNYGATVVETGPTYEDSITKAEDYCRRTGAVMIHSTNHPGVIAGGCTLMDELFDQCLAGSELPDAVVVSIGGGSQAAGAILVGRARKLGVPVFGAQAESAPAVYRSWQGNQIMAAPSDTVADGLATGSGFEYTHELLVNGLEDFFLIPDSEIIETLVHTVAVTHTYLEPAAVVGLCGGKRLSRHSKYRRIATVLTGANMPLSRLVEWTGSFDVFGNR